MFWSHTLVSLLNGKSALVGYLIPKPSLWDDIINTTGWNDKIVDLEKTTWFHFRLIKTGFLFFFVADHLLIGQLCTNSKSDRSLLSCLKVTQCSMNETGDAPLYNSCALPIQVMTTGPLPAPSKCKSGLSRITGTYPGWWKQSFRLRLWCFMWGHIMLPHIYEVGLKVNPKVYLDVLKSVVIPWCNQVVGGRHWVWQQDLAPTHKSKETQAWLQKECYDFVPFSHWPSSSSDLNPQDYFVWSYAENIINMTSYNSKASLIAAIHRVFIELSVALVEKACFQFRIRIKAVIDTEVSYIE